MIRTFTFSGVLLLITAGALQSQHQVDSLAGFNESAAIRASVSENFTGAELRVHLNQLKRKYINDRFSFTSEPINDNQFLYRTTVAGCVNEDFESSSAGVITATNQVSGWSVTRGYNTGANNNCNLTGCCTTNPVESELIVAPNGLIDNTIGSNYPIYSVFGSAAGHTNAPVVNPQITSGMFGNNFIRINSNIADYSLERISKTFSVTSSNALFRFAFIAVQSAGHQCCDAGGFILRLTNITTNTFLSAPSYSASGLSASCSTTTGINYFAAPSGTPASANSVMIYNKWHVNYIDLTPYIGQNINIQVTAGDCTAGGHYAYAYFDAQCGPVEIEVNGENKNLSCTSNATVTGPANLNSYQWNGPLGFNSTQATFTTNTPGVYSLTIPQNPPYQALHQTLNLVISPASITVTATKPSICVGESVVLTGGGLVNYNWNGSGSAPSITVNPTSTTTYTLTGTNTDNCPGFAMHTVSVSNCTGIENQQSAAEIVLFPNPNNGEFALNVSKPVVKAELLIKNALGQVVHLQTVVKGENKIRTKGLAAGVYYYSVSDNNTAFAKGTLKIE